MRFEREFACGLAGLAQIGRVEMNSLGYLLPVQLLLFSRLSDVCIHVSIVVRHLRVTSIDSPVSPKPPSPLDPARSRPNDPRSCTEDGSKHELYQRVSRDAADAQYPASVDGQGRSLSFDLASQARLLQPAFFRIDP